MKAIALVSVVVTMLVLTTHAAARDIYVDSDEGLETNDGLMEENGENNHGPFKTIHRGMRTAQPGDTVHLVRGKACFGTSRMRFLESAVFHNRECPADKPITLDGHNNTISGAEPVDLAQWEPIEPGLYRKTKLLKHIDAAVIGRFFFRFDGKMQHMGRTSKGPSAKLKDPKELAPGEWTFVAAIGGDPKNSFVDGAFYVKIDPAKSPSDYVIEYPARSAGVQISGRNENIVVRNLIVQHVYNDGYNIHGYSRGVLFENVQALECGDDGISAHDDCRITVRNFISVGNSTGFCHTNDSYSDSENVEIFDCLGFDVFVLGTGKHTLKNSHVMSSASSSVVVNGPGEDLPGHCTLEMDGVRVTRLGKNKQVRWLDGSIVRMTNCDVSGFDIACSASEFTLRDSRIGSAGATTAEDADTTALKTMTIAETTKFTGANNVYDLKKIVRGALTVTRENYAAEAAKLGDSESQWRTLERVPPKAPPVKTSNSNGPK